MHLLMRHGRRAHSTGWLRQSVCNLSYFGEYSYLQYGCNSFDAVCACSDNEWQNAVTAAELDRAAAFDC